MSACLSIATVEDFLDERLAGEVAQTVAGHLAACATCAGLLGEARELREAEREIGGVFTGAEGDAAAALPVVAGYEVLLEMHRGGQGIVYEAVQLSTGRRIALKVLIRGARASPQERYRFEREVALAGALKHPGIVTVLDGGPTPDGAHFLAMEMVEGERLDRWAAERAPAPAAAVALFGRICDAVQHAHQHGVIHRDLKPGNILVDDADRPKVLDFGLARRIAADERSLATATGDFVGTIAWSAPEQLRGASDLVDVRVDVYALGTILWWLLAGAHPFPAGGDMAALVHQVTTVDPPRPSARRPGIDRDLDAIVLKAMSKDPAARYASVADFARDLERFRLGVPVEARGQDFRYVAAKFVRRHRLGLAAGALILLALVGATAVSLWFWRTSVRDRDAALAARAEAEAQEKSAQAEAERSAEVVSLLRRAMVSSRSLRKGREMTMADFLDDVGRGLDERLPRFPQAEATLRATLGETFGQLGIPAQGVPQIERAVALLDAAEGPEAPATLAARHQLLILLVGLRRFDEAEPLALDLAARNRRLHGPGSLATIEVLVAHALAMDGAGRSEAALGLLEDIALRLRDRTDGPGKTVLSRVRRLIGFTLNRARRFDEAERLLRGLAEDASGGSVADGADRALVQEALAYALFNLGRPAEAYAAASTALEEARAAFVPGQPSLTRILYLMGLVCMESGRREEAERHLREMLAAHERVPYDAEGEIMTARAILGQLLVGSGRFAEAEGILAALADRARAGFGPEHATTLSMTHWLAEARLGLGRAAEAAAVLEGLLDPMRRVLGPDHAESVLTRVALARSLRILGRTGEAAAHLREVASRKADVPGLLSRADVLDLLAEVLREEGKDEEAERAADRARGLREGRN